MTSRSHSDVEIMLTNSHSRGGSVVDGTSGKMEEYVFDSAVPETYATIGTAQQDHAKYQSHQVKHAEIASSDGKSVVGGGSEGGGGGGGGGGSEGVPSAPAPRHRYEARNVLYEDNELPSDTFKHRGVHAGSYNTYKGMYSTTDKKKVSHVTCSCQTRSLAVGIVTGIILVLSVAALILSTLLWFGVYTPPSSSSSSSSPSSSSFSSSSPSPSPSTPPPECDCPTASEIEEVTLQLNELKQKYMKLKNDTENYVKEKELVENRITHLTTNITQLNESMSSLPTQRAVVLPDFGPFDGCTTTPEGRHSCDIPPVPTDETYNLCVTPHVEVDQQGTALLTAECRITGDNPVPDDENIIATLETFLNSTLHKLMRCRCTRILQTSSSTYNTSLTHSCSLIDTRCPLAISINGSLAWNV